MRAIAFYIEEFDLGEVLTAPFQMRLRAIRQGREPDILFIAGEHLARLNDKYLDGPCDLAVEIASPESVRRDRIEKLGEYKAAGVGEYWMVGPAAKEEEFYVLNSEGHHERPFSDEQGIYRSQARAGFAFPVAWLRQSPLPKLREAREWSGCPDRGILQRYEG
ncbi:MAG: Uma2 family endonuclease [Armatimonadetes bacterium]|nr:Uma2 family endonuclease [Armatimonadota bacterium]